MSLAEELAQRCLDNQDSQAWVELRGHDFKSMIANVVNEAIERCAQVVDKYQTECNDAEPGQHAKAACSFVAARIRSLKG